MARSARAGPLACGVRVTAGVSIAALSGAFEQLAAMVRAGVPLRAALSALAQGGALRGRAAAPLTVALLRLRGDLDAGLALSSALRRQPELARPWVCALVEAGEVSGQMAPALEAVARELARAAALRARLRGALTYPVLVAVVALAVSALLVVAVVPQFAGVLQQLGGELPAQTRLLLALSGLLQRRWGWLLLAAAAATLLAAGLLRRPALRLRLEQALLRFPVVGAVARLAAAALFARIAAMLLRTGVALPEALAVATGVMGWRPLALALLRVREAVRHGDRLSVALHREGALFPALLASMVAVGEETGELSAMLERVAELCERELEGALSALTAAVEPLLILALALMVGWVIAAVMGPTMSILGVVGA